MDGAKPICRGGGAAGSLGFGRGGESKLWFDRCALWREREKTEEYADHSSPRPTCGGLCACSEVGEKLVLLASTYVGTTLTHAIYRIDLDATHVLNSLADGLVWVPSHLYESK